MAITNRIQHFTAMGVFTKVKAQRESVILSNEVVTTPEAENYGFCRSFSGINFTPMSSRSDRDQSVERHFIILFITSLSVDTFSNILRAMHSQPKVVPNLDALGCTGYDP